MAPITALAREFCSHMSEGDSSSRTGATSARAPATADADDGADPSSIADVFANMLDINEDMIAAAGACHAEEETEGSIAYQRLLHRNLMEMANFIDARFGVYTKSEHDDASSISDSDDEGQSMDGESESRAAIGTLHLTGEGSDDLDRPTDRAAPQPSSALLATLEAEEEVRVKQRTQKRWIEARDLVRQEESAAALTSATNQLPTVSPSIADSGGDSTPNQVPDNPPSSDSGATDAVSVNSSANTDVAMAVPDAAPPSAPSTPPSSSAESAATVAGAVDMPALDQLAFTEAVPPMSDPRLSAPGAMAAFASVSGAKIALPPPHSLINMLYPVAASVYPPIQLSTICPDCVLLQKSSHECRMVLKHVTPSLVLDPAAVPGLGLVQWPPPPPIEPRPTPPRPFVSVRVPGKTFKRMCEDCRKCHLSVHRCRVVLQHTAPEWQPAENAPPPIPRRRKPPQAKKKVGS